MTGGELNQDMVQHVLTQLHYFKYIPLQQSRRTALPGTVRYSQQLQPLAVLAARADAPRFTPPNHSHSQPTICYAKKRFVLSSRGQGLSTVQYIPHEFRGLKALATKYGRWPQVRVAT